MILADLRSVEHRVERSDFINLHGGHFKDLGSLVHGGQGQEVVVLFLGNEQDWNDSRRLVVVWILGQELVNGCIALLAELKWRLFQVVLSVSVVGEGTE